MFIKNGKLPSRNDSLWSTIKLVYDLPREVTVASIYTTMSKKYSDLVQKEEINLENSSNKERSTDAKKSSDSIVSSEDECSIENEVPVKKFHVNISASNWEKIKPTSTIYHRVADNEHRKLDRQYHILPPGVWTYVLSRVIARERKEIPCRWTFKRCKVNSN